MLRMFCSTDRQVETKQWRRQVLMQTLQIQPSLPDLPNEINRP